MLSAIRKNSLSVVLSAVSFTGYGAWLSLPESASVQSIYDRYIAKEESRPRVFEEGIRVRLNRDAPPVAALEEALRDQPWAAIERTPGFNVRPTELRIQPAAPERLAIRILSENESFNRRLLTAPIAAPVDLPAQPRAALIGENRRGASFVPTVAASSSQRPLETLAAQPMPVPARAPAVTNVISLSKAGVTRDQLLAALFVPMSQPRSDAQIRVPSRASALTKSEDVAMKDVDTQSIASHAMGMVAPAGRQIMIRGPIELSGGLALTHAKDRIAVLRESRGQFVESGAVWIREARYEIFVESLEGQLVAEVRSPQGDVVGRGQLDLTSVVAGNRNSLEGVALRVLPITPGIAGRVQSAYTSAVTSNASAAVSKGVQGARVEFLQTPSVIKSVSGGHFEDAHFTEGSRVVANIQAKDHWPTLATLTSGQETVVPVFSKKMMQAFVSLTSKDETSAAINMKTMGVVWGRVTRAGQTVAGAKVEVVTEGTGEPVYFNDLMLPDKTLTTTGSNGLFAVPAVGVGAHALQIRLGRRVSDPVFLQADAESVASLELDVLKASEMQARAFDAFRTDLPIRAEVRPMGHAKSRAMNVEIDGSSVVKLANLGMPSVLEVDGGSEYLPMRMIQNPDTRHLYLPMVQRSWFDRVIGRIRYNMPPQTGTILGFIQGTRFRVSMDDKSLSSAAKIFYFDARGEMTTKEYGEPGGGFILVGVANGLQTVVVEADGSDRVYAATVLVEDSHVAAVSHWLR